MGRSKQHAQEKSELHIIFPLEDLKGREDLGEMNIDLYVILEWILEKGGRVWTGFIWPTTEAIVTLL
jgi:hypothetical protein